MKSLVLAVVLAAVAPPSSAAIISVFGPPSSRGAAPEIIAAPASLADDKRQGGAVNLGMQGFNERPGVLLSDILDIDGPGVLPVGTLLDSHMIFLNTDESLKNQRVEHGFGDGGPVVWTFSRAILGVISNSTVLDASDGPLGLPGTDYPSKIGARGLEGNPLDGKTNNDFYRIDGNVLRVAMKATEPGDWIRVVSAPAPIPLPAAGWLLIAGLGALAAVSRRKA